MTIDQEKEIKFILIAGLSLLIGGCSLNATTDPEPVETPLDFKESIHVENAGLNLQWWKNFHDPNLNELVDLALTNNIRHQIALKNVEVANTFVTESIYNRLPNVNVGYNVDRATLSHDQIDAADIPDFTVQTETIGFNYLYGSVYYDMDLWGKKANLTEQTRVNVEIAAAESRIVRLTLISEVTNIYFHIATLNSNVANLQKRMKIADANLKIAKAQENYGLVTSDLINEISSRKEKLATDINDLEKERKSFINHLAYLLGEYPENFNYEIGAMTYGSDFDALLPPSMPSEVVANRPDIQSSFLQIKSFGFLQKQVIADFLPSFNLYATYGPETFSVTDLIQNGLLATYGFNIVQKLTNIGSNYARYERVQDEYDEAVLRYKDTVINAFKEVDNALLAYKEDLKSLSSHKEIVKNKKANLRLTDLQYKAGAIDYATYLNSELDELQGIYDLATQNLKVFRDVIQIYKALGLGVGKEDLMCWADDYR